MTSTFKYLDVNLVKKEIHFRCEDWQDWPAQWRTDHMREMYEWIDENLPHHVDPDWSKAKKGREKAEIRRWLNGNCMNSWSYTVNGVAFSSERDAILFRMWFG